MCSTLRLTTPVWYGYRSRGKSDKVSFSTKYFGLFDAVKLTPSFAGDGLSPSETDNGVYDERYVYDSLLPLFGADQAPLSTDH